MVVIETNLTRQIQSILNGLEERLGETYVTDAKGLVLVVLDPSHGIEVPSQGRTITEIAPQTAECFAADNALRHLSDDCSFIAKRVQLDANDASSTLGIVLKLSN